MLTEMEVRRERGRGGWGGLAGRYEGRRRGDEIRMTGVESEERIREERRLKRRKVEKQQERGRERMPNEQIHAEVKHNG